MVKSNLRVYYGPHENATTHTPDLPGTVRVSLGEIFPLLTDAVKSGRTWLQDFEHDDITISSDLHEVILAYQHFRRPSA